MKPFAPSKIAQIEIHCTDLQQARQFYCESLGLECVGQVGDSIFVRCGEILLMIQQTSSPRRGSTIYFGADGQIEEAVTALRDQGISFSEEPKCIVRGHQGTDIWLGFFSDPWGNPLALISHMPVA